MAGKIITIVLLSFMFVLSSCGTSNDGNIATNGTIANVSNTSVEATERDFIYRLVSKNETYDEGGAVHLHAELEYVGDQEQITIYHAASPFHFPMYEITRNYTIGYAMEEPLLTTTLQKEEAIREVYKGSGGYGSEDDAAYISFMKQIMKNEFPAGHYEVHGFADFYVENANDKQDYLIEATIDFTVQ